MPIYITNAEAERLARELAASTGETITDVVIQALRERRERLTGSDREARLRHLRGTSKEIAAMLRGHEVDIDALYDDAGAPK